MATKSSLQSELLLVKSISATQTILVNAQGTHCVVPKRLKTMPLYDTLGVVEGRIATIESYFQEGDDMELVLLKGVESKEPLIIDGKMIVRRNVYDRDCTIPDQRLIEYKTKYKWDASANGIRVIRKVEILRP